MSCDWKLRFECVIGLSSDIYVGRVEKDHNLSYQSCAQQVDIDVFHCVIPVKIVPTHSGNAIMYRSWNSIQVP